MISRLIDGFLEEIIILSSYTGLFNYMTTFLSERFMQPQEVFILALSHHWD